MEENEELTTSYANSEPSLYNAPITPTESTCNAHGATLTEGEKCFNILIFFHKPCYHRAIVSGTLF